MKDLLCDKRKLLIFIHSEFDDLRLSGPEFRIYCHLCRRSGENGAYPGIASICEICCFCEDTVKAAIKTLISRGLITITYRPGDTNVYTIVDKEEWPDQTPFMWGGGKKTPPPPITPTSGGYVRGGVGVKQPPRRISIEGSPVKEIQKGFLSDSQKKSGTLVKKVTPDPEVPLSLRKESFIRIWDQWVTYRRGLAKVKDFNAMFALQLSELEPLGVEVAIQTIKKSLMNGYRGLFPPTVKIEPKRQKSDVHYVLPSQQHLNEKL